MHRILSGRLQVDKITIALSDLPTSLENTKIVHLTDLHYDGIRLSEALLAEAIAVSNAEDPDLVLLTGDYITDDPSPVHDLVSRLQRLESRQGIYACLGNHDIYYPFAKPTVTEAFTSIGIEVLWNAIAYPFGEQLPIVGLADYWSKEFNPKPVFAQLNPNTPRIVLSHNPDTAAVLESYRVDLQLSGHTHGGQVILPKFGAITKLLPILRQRIPKPLHPWIPYVRKCSRVMQHWEWTHGYHIVGNNQLYVNRGLGTYSPGRFLCPPEVTVITLVSQ